MTFINRMSIWQLSICHLENLWTKKVKAVSLTQNLNMFYYHFPVILVLHFEPSVKCCVCSCSGDQKGANAIQGTFHATSASNKPAPFIQFELLAQQAEFLFKHLEILFVKER